MMQSPRRSPALSHGFCQDFSGSGILLFGVGKKDPVGHIQRSPAEFGFGIDSGAVVDKEFHNSRLTGNNRSVQGSAAAPPGIAEDLTDQLIHIERVVKKEIAGVALHGVVAEVGVGMDIVAEFNREF